MGTKKDTQLTTIENLKTIKEYYAQIGDFIISEQGKNRKKELEVQFTEQLEDFLKFWERTMKDFQKISQNEIQNVLQKNEVLAEEMKEILEKTTGFRAPPDKLFLTLLAVRKIALRLNTNDSVKYLNFDYFKNHTNKINEHWIKVRKDNLKKKIKRFENKLKIVTKMTKVRLNQELGRLHHRRQKHLKIILAKYNKCKQMVDVINAKESYQLKKLKKHFLLRNDVPITTYKDNGKGFLEFSQVNKEDKVVNDKNFKLEDELISNHSDEKTLEFN